MIASIEGRLAAIGKKAVVVQVGGVGFRVHVPDSFIVHCGPVGSIVSLYTHLHVRQDELALYGCATESELRLFELLLGVSGVGPRVALSLLSVLSDDELRLAIAAEQIDTLTRVPGVGARTAKKIVLDLKDKVEPTLGLARPEILDEDTEVIAALTGLGYSIVEAQTALQHVPVSTRGVQERLRAALVYLGS